jgi:hypothetical protein
MFQGLCQIPASHRIHAPPGSPPLRLCLALVQHQIHERPGSLPLGHTRPQPPAGSTTRQDPHPLGHAGPQSHNGFRPPTPIPAPKAALGPSPVPDPCSSWIPTSWAMLDPHTTTAMRLIHTLPRSLPLKTPPLRPCWAQSPCGMTRATPHWSPWE